MAITSLPTPPSRSDPENFAERADTFMAALPGFAEEANAMQSAVEGAVEATEAGVTAAAASKDAAQASQGYAAQAAAVSEAARDAASQKAEEAFTSAARAEDWATKTDGPVAGGQFSAKHYAEQAAQGIGLPIYDSSNVPTLNIGPIYISGQGTAEWDASQGAYRVRSDVPLASVDWCPLRTAIWAGYIPGDGQILNRATDPDLTQMVIQGRVPVVDDAEWLADPLKRGCYTLGDGSTTIRVPDYNGKSDGAYAAVVLRGDGLRSAGTNGMIQADQLGPMKYRVSNFGTATNLLINGTGQAIMPSGNLAGSTFSEVSETTNGTKWITNTGDETRMTAATGCFVIKAFGAVVNPGSADAAQLATDYAALNAAFQSLDGALGFAIIYPGGGDASSPGTVAINTRYITSNPFPGYSSFCKVELLINGTWGDPQWLFNNGGQGVRASQHNDGGIVTQTGSSALFAASGNAGSSFGLAANPPGSTTPTPCRVKVWKSKGTI